MEDGRRPLPSDEVNERFPARRATGGIGISVEHSVFVQGQSRPPTVTAQVIPVIRPGRTGRHYEVVVEIDGVRAGARALPPPMPGTSLRRGAAAEIAADDSLLGGFAPPHLPFAPRPRQEVPSHRTLERTAERETVRPTAVLDTDARRAFQDTTYPWGTIGLIETPLGRGSGVMIGPRHLLTVGHAIDWRGAPRGFAASWVRFTPSAFDGDAPFGRAHGIHVYWYAQDDGDGSLSPAREQSDYVVVVLNTRIGERTGWMGARGYAEAWDALGAWHHMGYPSDLNSGQRPVFVDGVALHGDDSGPGGHRAIRHHADVFEGQFGGPMFGWWDGDACPRAVATHAGQTAEENVAAGGADLARLVAHARTEFA
jgi:V8-like Glu-specific endopeptidase